jgi:hypothetical protein
MGLREDLLKRIERKQQEIQEMELRIREANAYVQAMQDTIKLLPKDTNGDARVALRPGSDVWKAQDAITKAGKPLHLLEILKAIGKPQDKNSRLALAGSLARYARNKQVFVRVSPNTFGLIALGAAPPETRVVEPPEDFGAPQAGEEDI